MMSWITGIPDHILITRLRVLHLEVRRNRVDSRSGLKYITLVTTILLSSLVPLYPSRFQSLL